MLGVWRSTRVYPGFKRGMTEGGNGRNVVWVEISVAETVMQLVDRISGGTHKAMSWANGAGPKVL